MPIKIRTEKPIKFKNAGRILLMENIIVISILVVITAGIIFYLIRAKKRGEKCVGCPYAKQCNTKCDNG